ncbi:hypothetical protein BY458DRAFT_519929 [Sporodiniella umbellata]|nr:hypothetical protein BY458DRAFT_519929 [Sporodiniella umbellata]
MTSYSLQPSRIDKRPTYPLSPPLSNYHLYSKQAEQETMSSNDSLSVEKAIQVYGSQPALLGLILSSKVEEDRRKAEEAKLRRKEIDYALERQRKEKNTHKLPLPVLPHFPSKEHSSDFSPRSTLPPLAMPQKEARKSSIDILLHPAERKEPPSKLSDHASITHSDTTTPTTRPSTFPPSPPTETIQLSRKRKREIQAITTIIETKEFPYSDDYLWKNNGNTIHKKSGLKSIYYKCSNGTKGCPVNKTVTFKQNGEYLIKYRGDHLSECNRIKRITHL